MVGNAFQQGGETPIEACRRKGHAFGARLWAVKCDKNPGDLNCLNNCHGGAYQTTLTNFFTATYADGSRLSNHSWGGAGDYDIGAATVDQWAYDNDNNSANGLQQKYLWFFAAGNDGPGANTIGNPAEAKNDVSAAAVYNGVNGSCWAGDSLPCDETKIVVYSSRGPTGDGRHGPDLAGASQWEISLCDGTGYCYFNGTSAGTPNLTALGALIRDWLIQRYGMTDPNAPLVKALLLNSGDYVSNTVENLPGTAQGWGRPNLMRLCDDWSNPNCNQVRSKWYEGQFTATGQEVTLDLPVQSSAQPLRCMLVWLDPPNLAGGGALINDLNLKITAPDGTCYPGNQFSGPFSTPGCTKFDMRNPDEGVRVQNPAVGTWVLRVQAANIGQSPQPFAVVCSGAIGNFHVSWTNQQIQDSCPAGGPGNNNGVIDPGETVTLPVTLTNMSPVTLTGVSGTLSTSTPGILITDNAATWPNLPAGASAQSNPNHFSFMVGSAVTCGTPIALNLAVTHSAGSSNTGKTLRVGTLTPSLLLNETFSGGIPATWTVVNGGNGPDTWTTANPCNRTIGAPFASPWAMVDSDCAGSGRLQDEQLITPSLNASSCARVVLEFSNQFRWYSGGLEEVADVDVSVDGGTTWTNVFRVQALNDGYPTANTKVVDITDLAAGKPNVKIRFHYYNANYDWWWAIDNVKVTCYVPSCNVCATSVLTPANLSIQDPNGNGVWDSGETVTVVPAWQNWATASVAATGTASNVVNPPGVTASLTDSTANYGTIPVGGTADCTTTGDCYGITGSRTAGVWGHRDVTFDETVNGTLLKTWKLHIGPSFADVAVTDSYYRHVETLFHRGITSGCTATNYCPFDFVNRAQIAVFLSRAKLGTNPPAAGNGPNGSWDCTDGLPNHFTDVPDTEFFCPHVHWMWANNIAGGCAADAYCPWDPVSRSQMAIFTARTVLGGDPPAVGSGPGGSWNCTDGLSNQFTDVPDIMFYCRHVHWMWANGITSGCSANQYCPFDFVRRYQMAIFLVRAFQLALYGP
jgi:hypothetical protein